MRGDAILITSPIVNMADVLEVYHRAGGASAATAMVNERCGTQFGPELCNVVCQDAELLFADLDEATTWDIVIAAEPALTTPPPQQPEERDAHVAGHPCHPNSDKGVSPLTRLAEPLDGRAVPGDHPRMRLLERDAVLAALTEYAADARGGDGRVVLVAGEAGVGKTALVEALRAEAMDARWLWGACEGSFTPRPLGPVYDVAGQVGGALRQACDDDATRQRIFRALLDELTATDEPTIFCIEDLHWADEATLDLLGFLVPRLRHTRAMLLATYRNDGLAPDHPLRMALGELSTQAVVRRVDLPPLSHTTVTALAGEAGIKADQLFELTAGNPFLVCEVLEAGPHEIPPSARDAVLARAARLSPQARAALDTCAVIGSRIEVGLLTSAADDPEPAMDECLTAGALVSDAGGFRFRHEIARRAVEEALPAHRRVALNQRVLDVLVALGVEDAARLAHHADAAGDAAAVLQHAPVAARQAATLGAHREAAKQYERALRYAEDRHTRAELLTARGAECSLIDHWHDAVEAQEEALALWAELGDARRAGDLQRQMARTMWRLCRGNEALAMARGAVEALESLGPSIELGWAYAVNGVFISAEGATAIEMLHQAKQLAEEFDDKSLLANALNSIGCMKPGLEGVDHLRSALEMGLAAGDDAEVGRAYANLQAILGSQYRLAESEQVFDDGIAYCADHDIGTYEHCLRGTQGMVLNRLGRWDEADELLTFDLSERELSPVNKISKLVALGELDSRRGRPTAAAALDEAMTYAEAGFEAGYILEAGIARLEAAWLAGDAEAVRREADRAIPVVDTHDEWYAGALATWVRRCGLPPIQPARVAAPYELMLAGDWQAAATAWRELHAPYEEGLALLDSDDPEAMQEAVRIFERMGATATVARGQAIMRQRGIGSIPRGARADTRANRFGLTRREQEVLALVAEGMTNAEIAAKLFIAEKTVDNHVAAVLAKMGVSSRHEAAKLADDLEAVAT